MTFLPVVTRELRVASRKARTFWIRFGAALVATGLFSWMWMVARTSMNAQGLPLFKGLSGLAMAYCLFSGVTAADSISEEKREGTLGLLFLTDLRGFDVVLGKLAATSLNQFYGLIAIFPLLALPMLLGGLTSAEFWRVLLALCITLFFSVSLAMLCSVLSVSDRKARGSLILLLMFVSAVVPFVHEIRSNFRVTGVRHDEVLSVCPPYAYGMAFDTSYRTDAKAYWLAICVLGGLSLFALAVASFAVPRLWQDKAMGRSRAKFRDRIRFWQSGGPKEQQLRARLLDTNPILWLASRPLRRRVAPYILLIVAGAAWLYLYIRYPREMIDPGVFIFTMLILNGTIKFWVASDATRLFSEDRRSGALELTLSTPLRVGEILRGQVLALLRQFLAPALIILFADVCMMISGARSERQSGDHSWVNVCLSGLLVYVADLVAIACTGMWLSLRSSKPGVAAGGTLVRILALPWVLFVVSVSLFAAFAAASRLTIGWEPGGQTVLALWLIISLAVDLVFATSSYRNLQQYFRLLATERFQRRVGPAGLSAFLPKWLRPGRADEG